MAALLLQAQYANVMASPSTQIIGTLSAGNYIVTGIFMQLRYNSGLTDVNIRLLSNTTSFFPSVRLYVNSLSSTAVVNFFSPQYFVINSVLPRGQPINIELNSQSGFGSGGIVDVFVSIFGSALS